MAEPYLQIAAFSRRVGVSPDLLRAWERRYGVPRPARTANGVRLYTGADEELVAAMRRALAGGVPAAEAARVALARRAVARADDGAPLDAIRHDLRAALIRLDDAATHDLLDELFGAYAVDTALARVVLPSLHDVGDAWACDEIGVGHEHFASSLIHGRLLGLARKWDQGHGPHALLACPSGELHTFGLLAFGLTLRAHGWRITYLGADTPIGSVVQVAELIEPAQVVLAAVRPEVFLTLRDELAELAERAPLALGGAGATPALAASLGARLLGGDPVTAAAQLASAPDGDRSGRRRRAAPAGGS